MPTKYEIVMLAPTTFIQQSLRKEKFCGLNMEHLCQILPVSFFFSAVTRADVKRSDVALFLAARGQVVHSLSITLMPGEQKPLRRVQIFDPDSERHLQPGRLNFS